MKQFRIIVKGKLGKEWTDWFENLDINFDGENTVLSGHIEDQSALHGILNRLRDLNLTLISVNPKIDKSNNDQQQ
ncbi:MAG: hypothetical protein K8S16_03225 [Bacteroidales bacterium]|nr:hypothetical protein [Bacteroidales bacterium]